MHVAALRTLCTPGSWNRSVAPGGGARSQSGSVAPPLGALAPPPMVPPGPPGSLPQTGFTLLKLVKMRPVHSRRQPMKSPSSP